MQNAFEGLASWGQDKMAAIRKRYFKMYFLLWKLSILNDISLNYVI